VQIQSVGQNASLQPSIDAIKLSLIQGVITSLPTDRPLIARVQSNQDGQATLEIDNQTFVVKSQTNTPLRTGSTVLIQVSSDPQTKQPQLMLVPNSTARSLLPDVRTATSLIPTSRLTPSLTSQNSPVNSTLSKSQLPVQVDVQIINRPRPGVVTVQVDGNRVEASIESEPPGKEFRAETRVVGDRIQLIPIPTKQAVETQAKSILIESFPTRPMGEVLVSLRDAIQASTNQPPPTSVLSKNVSIANSNVANQSTPGSPVTGRVVADPKITSEAIAAATTLSGTLFMKGVLSGVEGNLQNPVGVGDTTLSQGLRELVGQLRALIPETAASLTAERVERVVRDGGQQLESKLGTLITNDPKPTREAVQEIIRTDLKGQLLQAQSTAPETHSQEVKTFAKELLGHIEHLQTLNVLTQQNGGPIHFAIPIPMDGAWQTAQIAFEADREPRKETNSDDTPPFNLLIHLDLTDFGNTWIDANVRGKGFSANLYIESQSGRQSAQSSIRELQQELKESGFEQIRVNVLSTGEIPLARRARFHAVETQMPEQFGLINLEV
jgi:hypothetical protein